MPINIIWVLRRWIEKMLPLSRTLPCLNVGSWRRGKGGGEVNTISKKNPLISIKISKHFFKGSLSSNNWQPLHYVNTRITSHHFIFRHCFHPATSCLYLRSFNNFFNQSMNFYRCAYFLTTRKSNVSLLLKVMPGRVADKKLIRHYKHFSKHLPVIYLFYGLYSHYRKHLYK